MLPLLLAALSACQPAPPISVRQLLQAPEGISTSWSALRGKAVIIDFWATWCEPCVGQIPEWNALVERYQDYPIHFISLSSEEPEDVVKFLYLRRMAGWIAIDPSGRTFNAYGIDSVPRTVLIDGKGIVRGITSLAQLTDSDIQALLAGRSVTSPDRPAAPG